MRIAVTLKQDNERVQLHTLRYHGEMRDHQRHSRPGSSQRKRTAFKETHRFVGVRLKPTMATRRYRMKTFYMLVHG